MVDTKATSQVVGMLRKYSMGLIIFPEGGKLQVNKLAFKGFSTAYDAVVSGVGAKP